MHAVTITINPSVDTSSDVDYVVVDRKLRCGPASHEPGGGGINVARVLGRLGSDATAVFPAGGPTGEILLDLLQSEGVRYQSVPIEGWTRENFTVDETSSNRQYQFILPGPHISSQEQTACLESIKTIKPTPDYIIASGSLAPGVGEDFYARVVRMGNQVGARVVVDTSGDALKLAANEGAFLLKPNLPELESLVGHQLTTEIEQEEGARELLSQGYAEMLMVSLGAGGALLASRDGIRRLRAPTVRTRSRVGAGDSMVGGTVHGLMSGMEIEDAARLGIAAGAAAVMTPGTQLCRKDDIERIYRNLKDDA